MFILLLIIIFSMVADGSTVLIAAFLAGLIVDLWNGDRLGMTSLMYIVVCFLLNLYKRKFNPEHLVFLLPFTLFIAAVYSWIHHKQQLNQQAMLKDVAGASIGIVVLWLFVRIWKERFAAKEESI
ncbi:MAG: rod shape-determining protein MreD [Candidatus Roizmanbacteria bacterium]|nr:rod shape-determining protein MreD [Candidatus Roizmanbacteria bacterium]